VSIRLVLADDHPIVLAGLVEILGNEADFEIVALARNGREALEAVHREHPDVLVLDLAMPEKDGVGVVRELAEARLGTRIVILSAEASKDAIEAVRLGAQGVVLKEMAPRFLVECIRRVHGGHVWLEKLVATRAVGRLLDRDEEARARQAGLTRREMEVARMVVDGLPSKVIAQRLAIAEGTAKLHVHHIYAKLHINGRMALVRYMRTQAE
jgi:DNA-binding NarL/FixJ family response regulator